MRSFGFQIWLERRSSRFSVSILEQKLNSAQASTLGEHFLASGPWIHQPMIHDVTKLKKRPRLGSLAARQTFFQAVDRLPRPGEVACIFSSLSSLNLLDQNWQRFGSLHILEPYRMARGMGNYPERPPKNYLDTSDTESTETSSNDFKE